MLFVEPVFFLFFAVVFAAYWGLRSLVWRKILLLAASYVFYGAWDYRFLSLILISTVVDYVIALRLEATESRRLRRLWLGLSLLVNLGILGFFKYFNFFQNSAIELAERLGVSLNATTLDIVLPVGISFYTFQTLSYTFDVYRGRLAARRQMLDVALFVAFFPQLVAGPIVRAMIFLPQLDRLAKWHAVPWRFCCGLFLLGFLKKTGISDNLAPFVDTVFADPATYSVLTLWQGVLLYAVQIYCDFSGYSDMAIAIAGMLGFQLPVNFQAPYLACSIADFWRRWHISLSSWLRDYLYIALGGNRRGAVRTYINLLLTMLLGGLWHGAAWTFVVWGGLHGMALIVHRLCADSPLIKTVPVYVRHGAGWALTFYWVLLAWIFFRAQGFADAALMAKAYLLFQAPGTETITFPVWPVLALLALIHVLNWHLRLFERWIVMPQILFALSLGVGAAVALSLVPQGARPFIYFQF